MVDDRTPGKDEVLDTLRREIHAAQLKVAIDEKFNQIPSPTVQRLANMKLPPIVRPARHLVEVDEVPTGQSSVASISLKPGETIRVSLRR
ncbi:MAG: hypothetical protein ABI563_05775 [Specibacter sp.]